MKRRPSILQKLWRALRSPKLAEKRPAPARRVGSSLEVLEGRIAPAALINPTTLVYKDLDGDIVTVKFTKSLFTAGDTTSANNVFKFSIGTVDGTTMADVLAGAGQQLQLIDLTKVSVVNNVNRAYQTGITITAVKTKVGNVLEGNGLTDIGYINGTGLPLGAVSITGDLGQIDAGSATVAAGLASLKVSSLGGSDPTVTQQATGRSLSSDIIGALGSLTVTGSVTGASVKVVNGTGSVLGKIGNVTIGGSLKGAAGDSTGLISSSGDIGLIKIGTDSDTDGIFGGGGSTSGAIKAGGAIAGLTVNGGITGSAGISSGSVVAAKTLGPVVVHGSLTGGTAASSGSITALGMGTVTIDGSILAGAATKTGLVASTGAIGAIVIGGDIRGDTALATSKTSQAGAISATGKIASLKVVGSIIGGIQSLDDGTPGTPTTDAIPPADTISSGYVTSSNSIGAINVGAIKGGAGKNSGTIIASGNITSLTVGAAGITGSTASTGINNGLVHAAGSIGTIVVHGSVTGGTIASSGSITAAGLGAVTIDGSILAGAAANTGWISSTGAIGAIVVSGDIRGDTTLATSKTSQAGAISATGKIASLTVVGSITGGIQSLDDGTPATATADAIPPADTISSGYVASSNSIGVINVGAIKGGAGKNSGTIIAAGNITSLTVGTAGITGSTGVNNGAVQAGGAISTVVIKGTITGGTATNSGSISAASMGLVNVTAIKGGGGANSGSVSATGNITSITLGAAGILGSTGLTSGNVHADGTISTIVVNGSVTGGSAANAGSISAGQLGTVTINGSLLAGASAGTGVVSSTHGIGTVTVKGDVQGNTDTDTSSSTLAGGIQAAGKITSVKILGALQGGAGASSGFVDAGTDLGTITVKSITGGNGQGSGTITAEGKLGSVIVTENLTGGTGAGAGSIFSGRDLNQVGDLGTVKIGGKVIGGSADSTGTISSGGKITSVTIGPAVAVSGVNVLQGAAGNFSGSILGKGTIGTVKITGNVEGGGGSFSGSIRSQDLITTSLESAGDIGTVTIVGHLRGGSGADSGTIEADGNLTTVSLGESAGEGLSGGAGSHSGSIRAGQGVISPGTITTVTVKGTLTGLTNSALLTGAIVSEGHIGTVTVTGATAGGAIRSGEAIGTLTFNKDVVGTNISAVGQAIPGPTTDLAIAKISILGSATSATIRAGYNTDGTGVNPDAQIGTVSVAHDWTTGDIMAGTTPGTGTAGDVKVGGTDNAAIVSQIASIIIKGNVVGTPSGTNNTDHFGFTAQKINSVSVHGVLKTFSAATPAETLELGSTGDFTAREIAIVA